MSELPWRERDLSADEKRKAPSTPSSSTHASYSLTVIAEVLMEQKRWDQALTLMEQSLVIDQRLASSDPTNVMWQKDVQVSRRMVEQLRRAAGK